jgi:hypothetical protein
LSGCLGPGSSLALCAQHDPTHISLPILP